MRRRGWFWAAIALQVLVLLGMIGSHGYTLWTGQPVMLKTVPVDPWDPLRGEYVTLSYEISRLEEGRVAMTATSYRRGESVWILLEPEGEYWKAIQVTGRRPPMATQQIAVHGTVERYDPSFSGRPRELRVHYGIEQFYVPEGEGHGIEQQPVINMTVEAMVDHFGHAALRRVYLEGKEIRWR